jgi:hypothetical protein
MLRQYFCSALLLATVGIGAMASQQDIPAPEQLVFGGGPGGSASIKAFDKPALSDLLTIDHSLSVFYDYLRQSQSLVSFPFHLFLARRKIAWLPVMSHGIDEYHHHAQLLHNRSSASLYIHQQLYSHLKMQRSCLFIANLIKVQFQTPTRWRGCLRKMKTKQCLLTWKNGCKVT